MEPGLVGALAELGAMGALLADRLADPLLGLDPEADEIMFARVAEWAALAELALALAACTTALLV